MAAATSLRVALINNLMRRDPSDVVQTLVPTQSGRFDHLMYDSRTTSPLEIIRAILAQWSIVDQYSEFRYRFRLVNRLLGRTDTPADWTHVFLRSIGAQSRSGEVRDALTIGRETRWQNTKALGRDKRVALLAYLPHPLRQNLDNVETCISQMKESAWALGINPESSSWLRQVEKLYREATWPGSTEWWPVDKLQYDPKQLTPVYQYLDCVSPKHRTLLALIIAPQFPVPKLLFYRASKDQRRWTDHGMYETLCLTTSGMPREVQRAISAGESSVGALIDLRPLVLQDRDGRFYARREVREALADRYMAYMGSLSWWWEQTLLVILYCFPRDPLWEPSFDAAVDSLGRLLWYMVSSWDSDPPSKLRPELIECLLTYCNFLRQPDRGQVFEWVGRVAGSDTTLQMRLSYAKCLSSRMEGMFDESNAIITTVMSGYIEPHGIQHRLAGLMLLVYMSNLRSKELGITDLAQLPQWEPRSLSPLEHHIALSLRLVYAGVYISAGMHAKAEELLEECSRSSAPREPAMDQEIYKLRRDLDHSRQQTRCHADAM